MAALNGLLLLLLLLSSSFLAAQASEPNCSNVPEFGKCLGITANFCPKNIECACKDGIPFCKCPNYRDSWSDYWYMGAKCDHLWNTGDLILVIVFPAAALASMAGVTVQWIYYCKNKPGSHAKNARAKKQANNYVNIPKINPAYMPDLPSDGRHPQNKRVGSPAINIEERYIVPPSEANANISSSAHHRTIFPHISRKPNTTYNPYSQTQPITYNRSVLAGQDYDDNEMDYPILPMARNLRLTTEPPQLPQEDYELNAFPANGLAQWSNRPFGMGHSEVRNQYGY